MTYAAHPTTPRLLSITLLSSTYCTYFPKYYSVFSCYTEAPAYYSTKTAEYYTEVAKYFSTPIYTSQSRLATQKLLFRATLKWNTTLMLQSTTPRPTLHLATTPQPSVHRRSCLLHNHVRCLASRNLSITLLQTTTIWGLYVLHQQFPVYVSTTYVAYTYTWKFWSIYLDVLKDCWNTRLINKSQVYVY
jgi:hypothetical protein